MLCRAVGFVLLAASVITPPRSAPTLSSVTDLLDRYDRGEYDAVVADLDRQVGEIDRERRQTRRIGPGENPATDPMPLPDQFASGAKRWVRASGASLAGHRRLVAATLALEIVHTRRRLQ